MTSSRKLTDQTPISNKKICWSSFICADTDLTTSSLVQFVYAHWGLGAFRAVAYRRCSIACSRVQLLQSAGSRVQLSWVQLTLSAGSGVHFL